MNKKTIEMYMGCALHEARFSRGVERSGMGSMIITRKTAAGMIVGANFLCDAFCLGVKDCFAFLENPAGYQALLDKIGQHEQLDVVDPMRVKMYVTGLVRWAKEIGFDPASEYRFCSRIFQGIPDNPDLTFQYGKDGVPVYISGPNDSPQRVQQIMATLQAYEARTGAHSPAQQDGTAEEVVIEHPQSKPAAMESAPAAPAPPAGKSRFSPLEFLKKLGGK